MRISRFGDLNDPFELLAAEVKEYDYRGAVKSWKSTFNDRFGVLCFSKSWKNPVLWSHYAAKHRGICLGFDLNDEVAMPVTYAANRISIRFLDGDPAKGLDESFVRELLCTKYEHWRYEDEVRIFVELDPKERENGSYFYPFSSELALREVILGPACELPIDGVKSFVRSVYGDTVQVRKGRLAFKWFEVVPDQRFEPKP